MDGLKIFGFSKALPLVTAMWNAPIGGNFSGCVLGVRRARMRGVRVKANDRSLSSEVQGQKYDAWSLKSPSPKSGAWKVKSEV